MLLSVQHNLSKTQTVLFTLVSGVTCLYVGLLGLRLRARVVWRGRGRGSSCPALTLLAAVCTGHVRHAGTGDTWDTRGHVRHAGPHLVSGIWSSAAMSAVSCPESHPRTCSSELSVTIAWCHDVTCHVMSRVTCPHLHSCSSARTLVTVSRTRSNHLYRGSANLESVNTELWTFYLVTSTSTSTSTSHFTAS